jgi:hypothetical protein
MQDVLEKTLAFFVKFGAVIFRQNAAESFNGTKRRSQVVRNGVRKGAHLLAKLLDFCFQFGDTRV